MSNYGEIPDASGWEASERDEPIERFETADLVYARFDGVTADEADTDADDAGDIDDDLPVEGLRFDADPGYTPEAHNQEIGAFLRSLSDANEADGGVSAEECSVAWQTTAETAMAYLDQGPTYTDEHGATTRTDTVYSADGTGHHMEVAETPAERVDEARSMFRVTIQDIGDERYSGSGARYRVGDDGVVYRTGIASHPQDAAPDHRPAPETPIGLVEAQRLGRLLLGAS